jgi:hypothetical protein
VTASSEESPPRLAEDGKPPARRRLLAGARTRTPKFVRWLVLLFIASLAVPALTKQWNDRKQELQVKEELLTDISKDSANAVYGAQSVVSPLEPHKRPARSAVVYTWLRERAAVDPRFRVYFSNSDAADHWFVNRRHGFLGFRNAVFLYALMACCEAHDRSSQIRRLKRYLKDAPLPEKLGADPWVVLACGPQEPCALDAEYQAAYRWLGNQILAKRQVLLQQLLDANATGFSSGWGDFVRDLDPLG